MASSVAVRLFYDGCFYRFSTVSLQYLLPANTTISLSAYPFFFFTRITSCSAAQRNDADKETGRIGVREEECLLVRGDEDDNPK